jgi:hypothetical protein
VRVLHEEALTLLDQAGCTIMDGNKVHYPPRFPFVLEEAIKLVLLLSALQYLIKFEKVGDEFRHIFWRLWLQLL